MKIFYNSPKLYDWRMPPFDKNRRITSRVCNGLENVLSVYVEIAEKQAEMTDNNIENYVVNKVFVVGSGARSNKINSDLDLLLVVPGLDIYSANNLKVFLQFIYFNDRPKQEAIDTFINPTGPYPTRASVNVSEQARDILTKYNNLLLSKGEPETEEIPLLVNKR